MKKYLLIFGLLAAFVVNINAQESAQKLGYVNSDLILNQLPEAIKAQGELDALINKWNEQLDSMAMSLQKEIADFQKQANTMPEDKRLQIQNQLIQKQQQLETFKREKFGQGTGEIYVKQEELMQPIRDKIIVAIEAVAKDEGMHFVFDKPGDVLLLYADKAFNITYKVLDRLNKE